MFVSTAVCSNKTTGIFSRVGAIEINNNNNSNNNNNIIIIIITIQIIL